MSTITTTIRWSKEELDKVKKNAQEIGLPVALYVKSTTLARVRKANKAKKPRVEYYEDDKGNFGLNFPDGMDAKEVYENLKQAYEKVYKNNKQVTKKLSHSGSKSNGKNLK